MLVVLIASAVAVVSASAGAQLQSTALYEFSTLSIITAASAALRCARYSVLSMGLLFDWQRSDRVSRVVSLACYAGVGSYALTNGVLDLSVPRHETDPSSYLGLSAAVVAIVASTIVVETKYRLLQRQPLRSLFESLCDDTFYIGVSVLTVGALIVHLFAAAWWLDTLMSAVVAVLAASRMRTLSTARL